MKYKIEKMIVEAALDDAVQRLGFEITSDYKELLETEGSDLIVIGLLKGSFVFMADLVRHINLPIRTDFMSVSSYGDSTESSGNVKILKDLDFDVTGKHLLLVEDIVDTGRTFSKVVHTLDGRGAKSVRTCTMLDKPARRVVDFKSDYIGFEIEDKFVIGYGLDYAEKYRELPYIGEIIFS